MPSLSFILQAVKHMRQPAGQRSKLGLLVLHAEEGRVDYRNLLA